MNLWRKLRIWWRKKRGLITFELQTADGRWVDITKAAKKVEIRRTYSVANPDWEFKLEE
jgi:hypothetical protein